MKLARLDDAHHATPDQYVALPLIQGAQSSLRLIRLAAGQALPPHRHGSSDLILYVVKGLGELGPPDESVTCERGTVAYLRGDEELQVRNTGLSEMTLLAFLARTPDSS
jgi:quercetin dioxygenase-like cupin family protein